MSGTGDGNAGAAQTVEPSPAAAGNLTAEQQQQVMHGNNNGALETPPRGGANNNNNSNCGPLASSASPPTLRPGIATALQKTIDKATTQSVAREFNRQLRIATTYHTNDALAFYDETCGNYNTLRVFASMKPNSSIVQVLWGLGKFMDEDAEGDVGSEVLAYVGDRDRFGNTSTMVALPRDNSYKWKEVKGMWDEAEFTQHYGIDANRLATRTPPPQAQEAKMLPRLLYLPYELGIFVAQSPRTPYEVYKEAIRLAGDDGSRIMDEHITLVKDWCMGASYRGAENSSMLVLKTTSVSSATEAFVEFKQKKSDWLLGQLLPREATPQRESQHEDMAQRVEQMTANIMARTMASVAERLQPSPQTNATGGTASSFTNTSNPIAGIQQLDGAELFAVMGFCGVTDPSLIPNIWSTYFSSASLLTKRGEIQDQMMEWSVQHSYPINKLIRFDKPWFTDVKALDLAKGEARATWALMERGFSAQYALPVSMEYAQKMNAQELAEQDTEHTRTFQERMQLNKTDPRTPPLTLEELQRAVATFAAMLYVHFGKMCDLYKKLLSMRQTLESHPVEHARACYTPLIVMQYWFEVLDKSRMYFFDLLRKSDFEQPEGPNFPVCSLSSLFPVIISGRGIESGMFPAKWNSLSSATSSGSTHAMGGGQPARGVKFTPTSVLKGGYGGYAAPSKPAYVPSGGPSAPTSSGWSWETSFPSAPPLPPPTFNNKFEHCHPIAKAEFAEYHKVFGGKLQMQLLLKHSNITMQQLLGMHAFRDASGNNNMCYSYVLGVCTHPGCKRVHPKSSSLGNDFVRDLCKQLKPGRDFLLKNPGLGAKRSSKQG